MPAADVTREEIVRKLELGVALAGDGSQVELEIDVDFCRAIIRHLKDARLAAKPVSEREEHTTGDDAAAAYFRVPVEYAAGLRRACEEARRDGAEGMREAAATVVEAQPFFPDTHTGARQQWVKDQAAAAIRALPLIDPAEAAKR